MKKQLIFDSWFFSVFFALILILNPNVARTNEINLPDTIITIADTIFNELDEVVVTGTRIPRKIIDIPYSVNRVQMVDFRYEKKTGSNDVMSDIPGLFLQSRYGNHDVRFSIRGFGSRSNSGIRGIRILLDDIPESEPDGQTRIESIDFQSIGRIEIAKGNASSLYTNAPGGVVNFINDMGFSRSSFVQFNEIGSFGLQRHGVKAVVRTKNYGLLTSYSHQQYDGYRAHNEENWNILNIVMETAPSLNTRLKIMGYFVDGFIRLPGSLTKEEFEEDPLQADQKSIDRDQKRISTKGRLGIRYSTKFGHSLNHEIVFTGYGTIKYFERTARDYRIINRYGLGIRTSYINRNLIGNKHNEFSTGIDVLFQPARTENYDNIGGVKGDQIFQLTNEKIENTGFYVSDYLELINEKLFILLTGRYDHIAFRLEEETLPSRSDARIFDAFTPKAALNYKLAPNIAIYTSFGLSFDSPAKNELDSFDPQKLYNSDLEAQESTNFEVGIKGNNPRPDERFFKKIAYEATIFRINIKNEIIPLEILGDVFFRNAAKTKRTGIEAGSRIEVVRGLDLILSYTLSVFNYRDYSAKTIGIDTLGNFTESEKDFSGNVVPSVPANNMYFALAYSHAISNNLNGFTKFSYQGISGLWVDDANTDKTDAYNLLNVVLGLDFQLGKFNLMLSGGVNNLTDEVYVGFTNTNSADGRFFEAGAPRNIFGSINLGFTF